MTIYPYVKTHNQTGLKYLGKTSRNPYKYRGSSKIWLTHLKENGVDISTEVIKECETQEELCFWGKHYSKLWDIVEDPSWANKIPETGGGPGRSGHHKGKNNPMYGKPRNDLKAENSPNKTANRRNDTSHYSRMRWQDPEYRDIKTKQLKELWSNPDYLAKMKLRNKSIKPVTVLGIKYNSLVEAATKLGLDASTVSKRCSSSHERFSDWKYD